MGIVPLLRSVLFPPPIDDSSLTFEQVFTLLPSSTYINYLLSELWNYTDQPDSALLFVKT